MQRTAAEKAGLPASLATRLQGATLGALLDHGTPVPGRWVCYSTDHPAKAPTCGVARGAAVVGDALYVAAFLAARHPLGLLVDAGLLEAPEPEAPTAPEVEDGRVPIFVPRAEPFPVSLSEFSASVLEALPEGTLYRFGAEVGVLERNPEGALVHVSISGRRVLLEAEKSVVFFDLRYSAATKTYVASRTVPKQDDGLYVLEAARTSSVVRPLRGVYTTPIVAGDFVQMRPGWNEETGIFYDEPATLRGLRPALHLTPDQSRRVLDEFLEDFRDAVSPEDLANAVGLIVTLLVRPSVRGPVPLHLALATTEGSGKTTLVDVFAGELALGSPAAHLRAMTDEEFGKTIFSFARRGTTFLSLDNVAGGSNLDSPLLAELVTAGSIEARVLGVSEVQRLPNDFVLAATGNNLTLSPEVLRRTVPIRFEPRVALRDRRFSHPDPREWVRVRRKAVLEVLLGAVERWKIAGRPGHRSGRGMPGFPEWSRAVGGVCSALGFEEWLEGLESFHELGSEWDHAARSFLGAWYGDAMLPKEATIRDLLPLIEGDPGALGIAAQTEKGIETSLGVQIRKMVGRPTLLPYRVEALRRSSVARRYRVSKAV